MIKVINESYLIAVSIGDAHNTRISRLSFAVFASLVPSYSSLAFFANLFLSAAATARAVSVLMFVPAHGADFRSRFHLIFFSHSATAITSAVCLMLVTTHCAHISFCLSVHIYFDYYF